MKQDIKKKADAFRIMAMVMMTAAFFAACSDDKTMETRDGEALQISVTAQDFASSMPTTRSADVNYQTSFAAGDKIGITVINGSTVVEDNIPYVYNSGSWSPDGSNTVHKYTGSPVSYLAYYPYSAGMNGKKTDAEIIAAFTPESDQSTQAAYAASDLMTGAGTLSGATLNIAFAHKLALVEAELPAGATGIDIMVNGGELVSAYNFGSNVYRCIVKPATNARLEGIYTVGGQATPWLQTGVELAGGQYTRLNVNTECRLEGQPVVTLSNVTATSADYSISSASLSTTPENYDIYVKQGYFTSPEDFSGATYSNVPATGSITSGISSGNTYSIMAVANKTDYTSSAGSIIIYAFISNTIDLAVNRTYALSGIGWNYANDVYSITGNNVTITGSNSGSRRRITVTATTPITATLDGASITGLTDNQCPLLLNSGANATLSLTGTNVLTAGYNCAGVGVPAGTKLTINGSGKLQATGNQESAGIGGKRDAGGGEISIESGEITAIAGYDGAGIGGGHSNNGNNGGTINISGGTVIAVSTQGGAGIGSGPFGTNGTSITISGGTVITKGGIYASGIGTGFRDATGTINISGGTIIAQHGFEGVGGIGFSSGIITLSGTPVIFATSIVGKSSTPATGIAFGSSDVTVNISSISEVTVTLKKDFTVPSGATLTIPSGVTLNLNGKTLTNNGDVVVENGGTVQLNGGSVVSGGGSNWTGNPAQ